MILRTKAKEILRGRNERHFKEVVMMQVEGTSLSISGIASSVGYCSSHSFRRAFKRRYAITPQEYRDMAESAVVSPQVRRT